eukprot:TRINITY_DN8550_c0_g1_i1.p1 TRINITY_DN8550_c0_g1~~TRINITY_DN8550_c0_g1_i1.p1  ORF type:complete len:290 (+),score=68.99 TRINITY_DN8550_c0_g1_i1:42-911(+)
MAPRLHAATLLLTCCCCCCLYRPAHAFAVLPRQLTSAGSRFVTTTAAALPPEQSSEVESADERDPLAAEKPAIAAGDCCGGEHETAGMTLQERIAASLGKSQVSEEERAAKAAQLQAELKAEKTRNISIAVGSFVSSAVAFFALRLGQPMEANALALLHEMETSSPVLTAALANGKPTVVDFYADWCENCRAMAPTMRRVEDEYRGKVNFVVVDGDSAKNAALVDAFRVDGIPHLALITPRGDVETALVGNVPRKVVEADLNALLSRQDLPYMGYDAFAGESHDINDRL